MYRCNTMCEWACLSVYQSACLASFLSNPSGSQELQSLPRGGVSTIRQRACYTQPSTRSKMTSAERDNSIEEHGVCEYVWVCVVVCVCVCVWVWVWLGVGVVVCGIGVWGCHCHGLEWEKNGVVVWADCYELISRYSSKGGLEPTRHILASFPGLLRLQFLIACCMQKRREKAWGISSRDLRHDHQKSSHLLSTAKWYTRPILHSVLATKMGQAPAESYTKSMKHTQAKSHDSERLQSDRRENTQQWHNHLMERKDGTIWSCTAYITAIPQRLSFEPGYILQAGLTSPLNLFQFSSFSVTVDVNVNKLLHLESVTSAVPRIMWWNSPGLLPPFLHTASDQKLEA